MSTVHRRCKRTIAVFVMFLLSAASPLAVTAKDKLIIGVEDNRYLPHYSYQAGEYGGFGRDLLDAFFSSIGQPYEYRALPVTRLFKTFLAGDVDFKYPANPLWSATEKKGTTIFYSEPVTAYIDGVSVLPDNLKTPVDDIRLLGTVRGFSAFGWQDRIVSGQIMLAENSSSEKLVQQALSNRIHGAYANIDVVQHILRTRFNRPQALVFDESLPHTRSHYLLASLEHADIIKKFNQWLSDNQALVETIKDRHGITARD